MERKQLDTILLKNGYQIKKKLSKSNKVQVFSAFKNTGEKVILKVVSVNDKWLNVLENEEKKMTQIFIGDNNRVIDYFEIGGVSVLVITFIPGKSLTYIKTNNKLKWLEVRNIISLLFEEVYKLHYKGYTHGDLKPSNIIYDGVNLSLIDFSGTYALNEKPAFVQFTPSYRNLKWSSIHRNTKEDDIYSCILIFLYLLTGSVNSDISHLPRNLANFLYKGLGYHQEPFIDFEEVFELWDYLEI